ncbi:hypothetical protein PCARR_b0190 [Pseudoalteromonas carrageenovora IAM 12662]|uniref:Uncharacterized protein n=1 Tax=Pseudoalteromonas carrageenovora IAM 12662 TaxID=1314868 RepID=A0ABR9EUY9_PSEVC|nr:hypothetical protein [Pseudoalteromonas carrageenovora IAM 12662]
MNRIKMGLCTMMAKEMKLLNFTVNSNLTSQVSGNFTRCTTLIKSPAWGVRHL